MEKAILNARIYSEKKVRKCMFRECQEKAIKSHVFQKNGILRQISENNHLIQLSLTNPFERKQKGDFDFKSIGINDVYTFMGFCSKHDSEIFSPIENQTVLNFKSQHQQALFCYRGLCQEIRRKEVALEWLQYMRPYIPHQNISLVDTSTRGYHDGIQNLNFFKNEIENCLESNNYDSFIFETIRIKKINVCISVPLNIYDSENPLTNNDLKIFTTSFINIFPVENESIAILGYHKDYPCFWTKNLIEKFKKQSPKEIFKEISDLITLRLEFWTMSKSLYEQIRPIKIVEYKYLFNQNVYNHNLQLETKLNLFEDII